MGATKFVGFSVTLDKSTDSFERIAREAIIAYKRRTGRDATTLFVHPFSPYNQLESIGLAIQQNQLVLPGQVIAGEVGYDNDDLQSIARQTNVFAA